MSQPSDLPPVCSGQVGVGKGAIRDRRVGGDMGETLLRGLPKLARRTIHRVDQWLIDQKKSSVFLYAEYEGGIAWGRTTGFPRAVSYRLYIGKKPEEGGSLL